MKRALSILLTIAALGCATTSGGPHRLGVTPPTGHVVYSDPTTGAGFDAAIGEIVQLSGGSKAWIKTTSSPTGWLSVATIGTGGGLSPIADQTTLANVSGSTADPSATSVGQMQTMLGIQSPGAIAVTGGTMSGVTDPDFMPFKEYTFNPGTAANFINVTGLNGDADGDYSIECKIISAAANNTFSMAINGAVASLLEVGTVAAGGGIAARTDWSIVNNSGLQLFANADILYVTGTLRAKSGRERYLHIDWFSKQAGGNNAGRVDALYTDTVTNITSFGIFTNFSPTLDIASGSFCRMTAIKTAF